MDNQQTLVITINDTDGEIGCLYTEDIDLTEIGRLDVKRASHIRFDDTTQNWTIVLIDGTCLGRFKTRKEAVMAEVEYLNRRILDGTIEEVLK